MYSIQAAQDKSDRSTRRLKPRNGSTRTVPIFCILLRVNRVADRMVGERRICGILIANLIKCAAGPQHRRGGQLRRYQQGVIN